jgi:hypothetical protein
MMINTINSNTNKLLTKVGLEGTPSLLHKTYLLAEIDNKGEFKEKSGNNIKILKSNEIQLKYQGVYLISYKYTSNTIENAYFQFNNTKIAQSHKSNTNDNITGNELFFSQKNKEILKFKLNSYLNNNQGSGMLKIVYFGNAS